MGRTTFTTIWSKTTPLDNPSCLLIGQQSNGRHTAQKRHNTWTDHVVGRDASRPTTWQLFVAIFSNIPLSHQVIDGWALVMNCTLAKPQDYNLMSLFTASRLTAKISVRLFCTHLSHKMKRNTSNCSNFACFRVARICQRQLGFLVRVSIRKNKYNYSN